MNIRVAYTNPDWHRAMHNSMVGGYLPDPDSLPDQFLFHDIDWGTVLEFLKDLRRGGAYIGVLQPRLKETLGPLYPEEDCL